MRVLVTGGAGFIGTNLVAAWINRPGLRVRVLDNGESGPLQRPLLDGRLERVEGDVREAEVVARAIAGCDAVVHLAAATGVAESIRDPRRSVEVNVQGTLNLLEAARAAGVARCVFASSNAAVGAHEPPLDETHPLNPVSPYGAGKAAGEALMTAYAKAFGLGTASLRFSNVYGPYSEHKGSVVAAFFRAALAGEPITVHGDGSQTRDFVFVEDLCEAVWLALQRAEPGSVFQIASGVETPIGELAEQVRRLVESEGGIRVAVRHAPVRAGDVARNYSRIELARARLGYAPRVGLAQGLRRTWEWWKAARGVLTAA
ncbi:MAG: NAD-dependent epimerase/dehydratase family protein [Candidatus Omnitrophica bacterium]|nr:NAD-dependent epimerase/dehydratase family protein [Candidatus Omnitrophota bacterium]